FVQARDVLEPYPDRAALALAYQNLCTCELRLGRLQDARAHYAQAIVLLRRFEMDAELVRLAWSVWEALAQRGDREAALPYLQQAAAGFHAIGMAGDAAEAGLDILEQLIALERYEEAIPLARRIASLCSRSGVAIDI